MRQNAELIRICVGWNKVFFGFERGNAKNSRLSSSVVNDVGLLSFRKSKRSKYGLKVILNARLKFMTFSYNQIITPGRAKTTVTQIFINSPLHPHTHDRILISQNKNKNQSQNRPVRVQQPHYIVLHTKNQTSVGGTSSRWRKFSAEITSNKISNFNNFPHEDDDDDDDRRRFCLTNL